MNFCRVYADLRNTEAEKAKLKKVKLKNHFSPILKN